MRRICAPFLTWLTRSLHLARARKERASSTSRSQHRQQRDGTKRPPSAKSRERKEGINSSTAAPVTATSRSTARIDPQEGVRTSARSAGTAASFSSSTNGRGLPALDSGRGPLSARTTPRSLTSSANVSFTDYSTDTPRLAWPDAHDITQYIPQKRGFRGLRFCAHTTTSTYSSTPGLRTCGAHSTHTFYIDRSPHGRKLAERQCARLFRSRPLRC